MHVVTYARSNRACLAIRIYMWTRLKSHYFCMVFPSMITKAHQRARRNSRHPYSLTQQWEVRKQTNKQTEQRYKNEMNMAEVLWNYYIELRIQNNSGPCFLVIPVSLSFPYWGCRPYEWRSAEMCDQICRQLFRFSTFLHDLRLSLLFCKMMIIITLCIVGTNEG